MSAKLVQKQYSYRHYPEEQVVSSNQNESIMFINSLIKKKLVPFSKRSLMYQRAVAAMTVLKLYNNSSSIYGKGYLRDGDAECSKATRSTSRMSLRSNEEKRSELNSAVDFGDRDMYLQALARHLTEQLDKIVLSDERMPKNAEDAGLGAVDMGYLIRKLFFEALSLDRLYHPQENLSIDDCQSQFLNDLILKMEGLRTVENVSSHTPPHVVKPTVYPEPRANVARRSSSRIALRNSAQESNSKSDWPSSKPRTTTSSIGKNAALSPQPLAIAECDDSSRIKKESDSPHDFNDHSTIWKEDSKTKPADKSIVSAIAKEWAVVKKEDQNMIHESSVQPSRSTDSPLSCSSLSSFSTSTSISVGCNSPERDLNDAPITRKKRNLDSSREDYILSTKSGISSSIHPLQTAYKSCGLEISNNMGIVHSVDSRRFRTVGTQTDKIDFENDLMLTSDAYDDFHHKGSEMEECRTRTRLAASMPSIPDKFRLGSSPCLNSNQPPRPSVNSRGIESLTLFPLDDLTEPSGVTVEVDGILYEIPPGFELLSIDQSPLSGEVSAMSEDEIFVTDNQDGIFNDLNHNSNLTSNGMSLMRWESGR